MLSFAAAPPSGGLFIKNSRAQDQSAAMSKIAPWVLERTVDGKQAEFLIVLVDQADLKGAKTLKTKEEKGRYVRDTLWNKAQATQGPLLKWLRDRHIEHRSYYIVNLIWVKAGLDVAQALAARPDVLRVEGNPQIHNVLPEPLPANQMPAQPDSTEAIEPGISYTRAPEVWAMGYTGQGIVVGGADTGYLWDHTALKNHYRGWDGNAANHNYNWHDSIHSSAGSCAGNSVQPCDDQGHGTHTMGTAVGDDGIVNQIGMAPGAKWIGCRNMDQGNGTPTTYIECMEFFLAPYPLGGTPAQGDPSKAPDISTNSWSCPPSEGCSSNSLQAAVEAQRAAGIMMVAAAQNSGPSCSTVLDPPGIYDAVYSIGALNTGADTIASFSSRGPVLADGSSRLKPDLSAPGTSTRSSFNTTIASYSSLSGTSMATPHVAGAVALLWSAQPSLRHDVSMTETILNKTAVHISSTACSSAGSPNNTFGYGRLDIKAAVDQALLPRLLTAVSRKNHPGAGDFDVDLPLTPGTLGIECRSSNGNHTLVFTFNNNVVSGSASVTSGTGSVSGSPIFSAKTMTVNLIGVTNMQRITVTLSGVTDNLSQVLPDTAVTMGVLIGDTTGNGSVNSSDISQTKAQSGTVANSSNFRTDVTVNGLINSSDISTVKSKSGTALP
jgi:serine protease AprX